MHCAGIDELGLNFYPYIIYVTLTVRHRTYRRRARVAVWCVGQIQVCMVYGEGGEAADGVPRDHEL
jgi:hypothetical protein